MSRKDNPDLAPDAVLAEDLGDPEERHAAQVAEMGGEVDGDIDDFDPTGLDDGSDLNYTAPETESPSDEVTESTEEEAEDVVDEAPPVVDEEAAEEADPEDDGEAEEEPATKGIPKHRFDEVNERRKAAEAELELLKAQQKAAEDPEEAEVPYDILAGEKEYMDLLLDGDVDAALAKRQEVDIAKEAKWRSDAKLETRTDINQEAEQAELISLSTEAEQMFDQFNPESDAFDQNMLNKVLTFMTGYEARGESRADAFVAGLADVIEMYGLDAAAPADDPAPKPTGGKKVDPKKAALADSLHTPVVGAGSGSAESGVATPDITNMTDEEFDALPEKAQARLRGDIL